MSNFEFLKSEWHEIYSLAKNSEDFIYIAPDYVCLNNRKTMELMIKWLYQNDSYLNLPYDTTLNSLIHEKTFKDNLEAKLFLKLRYIQKVGNQSAHGNIKISEKDALYSTQELFHFLYWVYRYYSNNEANRNLVFDVNLIPTKTKEQIENEKLKAKLQEFEQEKTEEKLSKEDLLKENQELLKQIQEIKAKNKNYDDNYDYSEAQTRDLFIDVLLKEAGWDISTQNATEYQVFGMPNDKGIGFVDYVLWGNDGKPLGVVEAKRTKKDARIGQRQAELYADCLQKQFNQRPIIFYSNGYNHYIWDDCNYPPREIQGFYKKDELQLLINRRESKKTLNNIEINKDITGRPYQEEAIKRVCEDFNKGKRKALVVMATGTGKTRTAISLVDVLMKNNWVKRVLFLADRTALVNQAKKAFRAHLPQSNAVDITEDKDNLQSRVVLSTYQTMMNLIDSKKGDDKVFSVGHFDLVIVDEAHRSIYQKFGAIFNYFDSLLIGLTATPKNEVDKNTYEIFELENNVPTFYYEYDEAVKSGYLVPYETYSAGTKFMQEGIAYADLSEDEKQEYEEKFYDEENDYLPEHINSEKLNKWLFNIDTVDKVIKRLMQNGLKTESGDKLGKTIIFAKNEDHAKFIQERFDKNYSHLKGVFARVITCKSPYAQSLINDFSVKEKEPTIAISVDMLDTGIDVPEVLNLVFFKIVRSKTKFYQMIGRGTRLCEDLLGFNQDKEKFYIFDACSNFEYFSLNPNGKEIKIQPSLSQKIFLKRLELATSLNNEDETLNLLTSNLKDILHSHIKTMDVENFMVRPHRQMVEVYSNRKTWDKLNDIDLINISEKLASLPATVNYGEEDSKAFDLLILNTQLAMLGNNQKYFQRNKREIIDIASDLEQKQMIPIVKAQLELILEIQSEPYWDFITIPELEKIRIKLRDLMFAVDKTKKSIIYSNFQDELIDEKINSPIVQQNDMTQYKKKVEYFLKKHQDHITIQKLRLNKQLTSIDISELEKILFNASEVGSKEDYIGAYGDLELGKLIRQMVGLDRNAVQDIFSKYLNQNNFNSNQIRFITLIIEYLTKNGIMEPKILFEQPFTNIHYEGIVGVFQDNDIEDLINLIKSINKNAEIVSEVKFG